MRIGALGAARITPAALVRPAAETEGVTVTAVAARDRSRAERFAAKRGIPRVLDSYEALVDDPEIDAVYNPLPNGLHGIWTRRALLAGKHVLCEKPFTANAQEAAEVAAIAAERDLVVMEAFHYRYHPVAARMAEIARDGTLGDIATIETWMCIPLPLPRDIRYRWDLAGGATMDTGCYAIHMNRLLAGAEPEVRTATARLAHPNVDRWMRAELEYPDGVRGTMTCALWSSTPLKVAVRVVGTRGELRVLNPTGPHLAHRMTIRRGGARERIRVDGARTATYTYQLRAFHAAVASGAPVLTPPADAVANMRVIDAVYRAAGLDPREPTRVS